MKKVTGHTRVNQQPVIVFVEKYACMVWTDWSDRKAYGTEVDIDSGVGWEAQPDPKQFAAYDCRGCSLYFLCRAVSELMR